MANAQQMDSPELRLLDSIMAARALSDDLLAARMGIVRSSFQRCRRLGFPSTYLRAKAEAALGYVPVWHSPSVVSLRRRCLESRGFDPALVTLAELRRRCAECGCAGEVRQRSCLQQVLDLFLGHLAAHPELLNPKKV